MMKTTRRAAMGGMGALGLSTLLHARDATALSGAGPLPGNGGERWRDLVRMQMSTRPEDVPWWYTGRVYAQVGDRAPRHLFNLEGTEIYWTREVADGGFAISSRTLTFFRDKDSGGMLREFRNPLTGETNEVAPNRLGGQDSSFYTSAGWQFTNSVLAQAEPQPWQIEWHHAGDLAWFTSSRFSTSMPQPWLESMSVFTRLDALLDRERHSLPAHFTSTYLSPWSRWMQMGERPGHLVWHSSGSKLESIDQVPDEYRQRAEDEYGGVLSARPESWD